MARIIPAALLALGSLAAAPAQDLAQLKRLPALLRNLPEHPRLFLQDEALAARRSQHESDSVLQRYVGDVLKQAARSLEAEALRYQKRGPRLLHVSRECLRRVQLQTLAFRWTGDERFARAARGNLLAVAAFRDWNPSHFLDTAEMSHAVGLGYDWLFDWLGAEDRDAVRSALIEKGLKPGVASYTGRGAWWTRSAFNWNQVCNAGLAIGALAIAETDPDYAMQIVPAAVRSLPIALSSYAPDGAWMEGPGYWNYATRYTCYGLAAFRTSLGTDFGLATVDGLAAAGWFPLYTAGPTGLFFNFADAGERSRRTPMPCLMWLAQAYDEPAFADADHALLEHAAAQANHVVWYVPPSDGKTQRTLDRSFRGKVELAVMRSGWDDPEALFCAVKAGFNQVNHGHLDLGTFVLDALGVRWALDLGSDDYNLPGYWEMKIDGRRWQYFRLNSTSHNVWLVDGAGQDPHGEARLVRVSEKPPFVEVDLGQAYGPGVAAARRGIALVDDRRALLIQDELRLSKSGVVTWGMTTPAEIEMRADGSAELTFDGKTLVARALSPAGARLSVRSAERQPPEKRNRGIRRLELEIQARRAPLRIAVQLCPVWADGPSPPVEPVPLKRW